MEANAVTECKLDELTFVVSASVEYFEYMTVSANVKAPLAGKLGYHIAFGQPSRKMHGLISAIKEGSISLELVDEPGEDEEDESLIRYGGNLLIKYIYEEDGERAAGSVKLRPNSDNRKSIPEYCGYLKLITELNKLRVENKELTKENTELKAKLQI